MALRNILEIPHRRLPLHSESEPDVRRHQEDSIGSNPLHLHGPVDASSVPSSPAIPEMTRTLSPTSSATISVTLLFSAWLRDVISPVWPLQTMPSIPSILASQRTYSLNSSHSANNPYSTGWESLERYSSKVFWGPFFSWVPPFFFRPLKVPPILNFLGLSVNTKPPLVGSLEKPCSGTLGRWTLKAGYP